MSKPISHDWGRFYAWGDFQKIRAFFLYYFFTVRFWIHEKCKMIPKGAFLTNDHSNTVTAKSQNSQVTSTVILTHVNNINRLVWTGDTNGQCRMCGVAFRHNVVLFWLPTWPLAQWEQHVLQNVTYIQKWIRLCRRFHPSTTHSRSPHRTTNFPGYSCRRGIQTRRDMTPSSDCRLRTKSHRCTTSSHTPCRISNSRECMCHLCTVWHMRFTHAWAMSDRPEGHYASCPCFKSWSLWQLCGWRTLPRTLLQLIFSVYRSFEQTPSYIVGENLLWSTNRQPFQTFSTFSSRFLTKYLKGLLPKSPNDIFGRRYIKAINTSMYTKSKSIKLSKTCHVVIFQ